MKLFQEYLYKHVISSYDNDDNNNDTLVNNAILNNLFNISIAIEKEINTMFNFTTDSKSYNNKTKTLLVNVKRNEELAHNIISGNITPKKLCELSIEQLATSEEQQRQQEILQKKFDAG